MGVYSDTGRVATGPIPDPSTYGSDRDKVRWAMMRADSNSPYTHPDRRDSWAMDAAVRRSHSNKKYGIRDKRAKRIVD